MTYTYEITRANGTIIKIKDPRPNMDKELAAKIYMNYICAYGKLIGFKIKDVKGEEVYGLI